MWNFRGGYFQRLEHWNLPKEKYPLKTRQQLRQSKLLDFKFTSNLFVLRCSKVFLFFPGGVVLQSICSFSKSGEISILFEISKSKKRFTIGVGFTHVLFSPLPGEMIQFDEHIFHRGWNQVKLDLACRPMRSCLRTSLPKGCFRPHLWQSCELSRPTTGRFRSTTLPSTL